MSDLTFREKRHFENLLGMGGGYLLDLTNRTFQEFVFDSVGLDIYDAKYAHGSGSKANLLRGFWTVEPNHVVGKLLKDLVEHASEFNVDNSISEIDECRQITERLRQGAPVPDIASLPTELGGRSLDMLVRSVKEAIDRNVPESGLDRLHTYVVKYMRFICEKKNIETSRDKPLHSLLGEYVKWAKREGHIESLMTERILKSSISTMEAFNQVRNEKSLAHDNPVLNYNESLLVLNNVVSIIRFIEYLEQKLERKESADLGTEYTEDDIPF